MSGPLRDFYEVLGVSKNAPSDDIKKAYRKLAVKYHPDKNPGDDAAAESFKEAATAYNTLSDPEKRKEYNRFGHNAHRQPPPGFNPADIFGADIFEHFFGKGARAHRTNAENGRGSNIGINLTIDFMEAVRGLVTPIQIERNIKCEPCGGEGGTGRAPCKTCGGSGFSTLQNGSMVFRTTCHACAGECTTILNKCGNCSGRGKIGQVNTVDVKIPAGVDSNTQLRLAGMGNYGKGITGDLFVNLNVRNHPIFRRSGKEIHTKATLTVPQAALGCQVQIDTVHGHKSVNIPPGIQYGDTLRIKGFGMPDISGGSRGDHKLEIEVKIPQNLSGTQKDLFQQLLQLETEYEN